MKPLTGNPDPISGAANELVSAMSSLNMEPNPLPVPPGAEGSDLYLSAVDGWAKHAMEHLHAAFDYVEQANRQRERLMDLLHHAEVYLCGREDEASVKLHAAIDAMIENVRRGT